MKYAHVLLAAVSNVWAIEPGKLAAIAELLSLQAAGGKFSAEEIAARIAPAKASAVARREGAVAVLPLRGVISNRISLMDDVSGGTSAEAFGNWVREAGDAEGVKAVILDVDSPGGVVDGVPEARARVEAVKGKKPIIAQVNANCASAAYWIASAADEIVVTPSGRVGSIGAMGIHNDISKALEEAGVTRTMLVSAAYKGELEPHLPLSEEARVHLQTQIDAYDAMFVNAVAAGRNLSPAVVRSQFGQGRMVMATDAVRLGMADRVATMDETLARFGVAPGAPSAAAPQRSFPTAREKRALQIND